MMELKESIMEFILALQESGIPVLEDEEIANIIYEDIYDIVESAKLVGINESFSSFKVAVKSAHQPIDSYFDIQKLAQKHNVSPSRALAYIDGRRAARLYSASARHQPSEAAREIANDAATSHIRGKSLRSMDRMEKARKLKRDMFMKKYGKPAAIAGGIGAAAYAAYKYKNRNKKRED